MPKRVVRIKHKQKLTVEIKERVTNSTLYRYFNFNRILKNKDVLHDSSSFGKYVAMLLIVPIIAIASGVLYKLNWQYCLLLAAAFTAFVPKMMIINLVQGYKKKKFNDANSYIEQMVISFKRKGKIIDALMDTEEISTGYMKKTIDKALAYIIEGECIEDIYIEALSIIEDEYKCTRIRTLHKFLIDVERSGGKFKRAIDILLDDARKWLIRTEIFQQEVEKQKKYIYATEAISLIIGITLIYTLPIDEASQIVEKISYQLSTMLVLISFILFFVIVQSRLAISWMDMENLNDAEYEKQIDKDYKTCMTDKVDPTKVKRDTIKSTMFASLSLVSIPYLVNTNNYEYIPLVVVFVLMFYIAPRKMISGAKSRLRKEVVKSAPIWIRELILELQTENVYNAIIKTEVNCPYVLKKEVAKLADLITNEPSNINSYTQFFDFLGGKEIYEITRLVRCLYSMTELGGNNGNSLLDSMVEENIRLTDKAEVAEYNDKVIGISTLVYAPIAMACIKMCIDSWFLMQVCFKYFAGF